MDGAIPQTGQNTYMVQSHSETAKTLDLRFYGIKACALFHNDFSGSLERTQNFHLTFAANFC